MFMLSEIRSDCVLLKAEVAMSDYENRKLLRAIWGQLETAPADDLTISWRILAAEVLDTMLRKYNLGLYSPMSNLP